MTKTPHAGRGMSLEAALDFVHELYWNRREILVRHYGVTGKWIRGHKGPRFVAFKKALQPPDYDGCIEGRKICFDAKSVKNKHRWRLDKRYEHQWQRLRDWSAAKAVSFFAVESVLRRTLYLYRIWPYSPWPAFKFVDAPCADILAVKDDGGVYDWLPVVEEDWL